MKVRVAKNDDYRFIYELSKQLGYDYAVSKVEHRLAELLNDKNHIIIVVQEALNEPIIGYIHLHIHKSLYFDNLLNIMGIVVDHNKRGKGIGSLLLDEAEKKALDLNCKGMRANSGIQRIEAHKFYLKNGYSETKMQKRFLKLF